MGFCPSAPYPDVPDGVIISPSTNPYFNPTPLRGIHMEPPCGQGRKGPHSNTVRGLCSKFTDRPNEALRSGTTTTLHRPHPSSDFHQHFLLSLHRLSGTLYLHPFVIPAPWALSKTLLKRTSSTRPTRHATDSHPSASPIHSFVLMAPTKEIPVID